jgi:hypothetical protein
MTVKMEERLWIGAQYLAKVADMTFSVPCSAILRDYIRAGTHNMLREKRTSEHDFEEADANLARVILLVIEETRKTRNPRASLPGPVLIREGAFVKAKTACPLWPFC